jgi:NADPH2:quinone reductase
VKAISVHTYGSPEALQLGEVPTPSPSEGESLVKIEYAGVNFADIYHRRGQRQGSLPFIPGIEGGGIVEGMGSPDNFIREGDNVVFAGAFGTYAQYAVVPTDRLVNVPESLDLRLATAVLLQGLTAHYLTRTTFALQPGDTCLIHAAAGGVGLLMCQMAKQAGAIVIGTVSSKEKMEQAVSVGADEVIQYTEEDFEESVMQLTNGAGVDVVFDSVGKTTFDKSLNCVKRRGMLVVFGQASGEVPLFDISHLAAKGSLFLTRPSLFHHIAERSELHSRADDIFEWVLSGELVVQIGMSFNLANAAEAHRQLESRKTIGKVLLTT